MKPAAQEFRDRCEICVPAYEATTAARVIGDIHYG
jgi:hypothetical protein